MKPGARLRAAMAEDLVVAPFIYDGFTTLIAEAQGAKALYMTGHGTSAQLGLPDVGLTSMAEMVNNLGYIVNAVDVPVIADADTGYGNAVNVQRTVREYEQAGAAAMHSQRLAPHVPDLAGRLIREAGSDEDRRATNWQQQH